MPDPITRRQYLNWLDHPVTRRLFKELKAVRQGQLEVLGNYHRTQEDQPSDDRIRGAVWTIDQVLEWEVGDDKKGEEE